MSPTAHLTAMNDFGAPVSTWALVGSLGALLLALMLPTLVIALCVTKWPGRRVDDEFGLGSVSLHDELWEFVNAVERGDVSLASLGATRAAGAGDESASDSPSPVDHGRPAS